MDRSGANFFEVVRQVKEVLGANPCPIEIPIGAEETFKGVVDLIKMKAVLWHDETMGADYTLEEIPAGLVDEANEWRDKMLEKIAEFDDALMEKYFDDPSTITEDEIRRAIRNATLKMEIVPMICGSSFKNKGVQYLLDSVCAYLPSPVDSGAVEGSSPDDPDQKEFREPSSDAPMCALAFKIATDPYVGRLTFFRVYSGDVVAGSYILNARSGKKERVSRLFQMHSNKQNAKELIGCGDIGAGVGFKDIRTGDTLCDENHPIVLEAMEFPDPVFNDVRVSKFVNHLMYDGKKNTSYTIFYSALELVKGKLPNEEKTSLEIWKKALENITPTVEVKSRRVGGATFQVPTEIRADRKESISMKNLIAYARKRGGKTMAEKLAAEIVDAFNEQGGAFKRKEDMHKMAEANRAFAHFRF